jgi:NAD(P)-dependent dehydrogenase (short-subunit alcohol dehydrogenase family)
MFNLEGHCALVTGAGQGVGAQIAKVLAEHGATVLVNDLFHERADVVVEEIRNAGGTAAALIADITNLESLIEQIKKVTGVLGCEVDILVNNAGIPAEGIELARFIDSEPSQWSRHIELNGYGLLNATYAVLPAMLENKWGRIVTITSDGGRVGDAGVAVYGAAKAMGPGFMRSLAKEVGPSGVTCNSLSLGSIANPNHQPDEERLAKMNKLYATRRRGTPEDIAPAVLLLVSDEGSWITGQTIPVNGGYATS